MANRGIFKEFAQAGRNDNEVAERFRQLCRTKQRLRALFVFTCADRAHLEFDRAESARRFSIEELHEKVWFLFRPELRGADPLQLAGYAKEEIEVLKDFGTDFFSSRYRLQAIKFGEHLVRLSDWSQKVGPKVALLREGTATMLGIATRDYRGLAAVISGTLWRSGVELQRAHLFSAMHHGLAFDFFHIVPGDQPLPHDLARNVEDSIANERHISDADEAALPRIDGRFTLEDTGNGLHHLRFETAQSSDGLIYALTYKIFRYLQGNIYGLTAHTARGHAYISIHFRLPPGLGTEEARKIIAARFGNFGG